MKKILLIVLLLVPSLALGATGDLSSGLTGYWPFDYRDTNWTTGKVFDRSGNARQATMIGMGTTTSPKSGKIGQSLDYIGSATYVVTNVALGSYMSATDGSISAWFYPTAPEIVQYGCAAGSLAGIGDGDFPIGGTGGYAELGFDQFNLCAQGYDGVVRHIDTSYTLNTWVHAVWTHTGSVLTLYVNGKLIGSTALGSLVTTHTVNIGVAIIPPGSLSQYFGRIDDVRMYNRALSADEANQLYRQGAGLHDNSWLAALIRIVGGFI